jgi:hypothetical protein
MSITRLIESLENIRDQKGDIDVQYQAADFGPMSVDYVIIYQRDRDSDGMVKEGSETIVLLS